jgi:hypothetical protein
MEEGTPKKQLLLILQNVGGRKDVKFGSGVAEAEKGIEKPYQ